ncbi:hypothetical protein Bbelb_395110 [Branchiostoma belcheri]|nr:hypothetical protein Bbelb_395110 [Branchiostoma belcheri]
MCIRLSELGGPSDQTGVVWNDNLVERWVNPSPPKDERTRPLRLPVNREVPVSHKAKVTPTGDCYHVSPAGDVAQQCRPATFPRCRDIGSPSERRWTSSRGRRAKAASTIGKTIYVRKCFPSSSPTTTEGTSTQGVRRASVRIGATGGRQGTGISPPTLRHFGFCEFCDRCPCRINDEEDYCDKCKLFCSTLIPRETIHGTGQVQEGEMETHRSYAHVDAAVPQSRPFCRFCGVCDTFCESYGCTPGSFLDKFTSTIFE